MAIDAARLEAKAAANRHRKINPIILASSPKTPWRGESAFCMKLLHSPQSQMGAEPVLDMNGVARGKRARRVLGLDLDDKETRTGSSRVQRARNLVDALHVAHHARFLE